MTIFHLIRHGTHDLLGRVLTGRMPGIALNAAGRREAEAAGGFLAAAGIEAVITSPLKRARETAAIVARRCDVPVAVDEGLQDVDFGAWTGLRFDSLETQVEWRAFNQHRATATIPGGETLVAVQGRGVDVLHRLHARSAGAHVALVGHGDPIKLMLLHVLGAPIDATLCLEIAPGSISTVEVEDWGSRVLAVNYRPAAR